MTSHTGGGNAAYGKGGSARLSRRRVLGGPAAASGGAALAVGTGAGTARAHGGVRTYVLVHGTHSETGFFWTAIGREPALRGHRVVMVDQPLHGTEKFVPKPIRRRTCGRWRRSPRRWPRSRWTTSSAG